MKKRVDDVVEAIQLVSDALYKDVESLEERFRLLVEDGYVKEPEPSVWALTETGVIAHVLLSTLVAESIEKKHGSQAWIHSGGVLSEIKERLIADGYDRETVEQAFGERLEREMTQRYVAPMLEKMVEDLQLGHPDKA